MPHSNFSSLYHGFTQALKTRVAWRRFQRPVENGQVLLVGRSSHGRTHREAVGTSDSARETRRYGLVHFNWNYYVVFKTLSGTFPVFQILGKLGGTPEKHGGAWRMWLSWVSQIGYFTLYFDRSFQSACSNRIQRKYVVKEMPGTRETWPSY